LPGVIYIPMYLFFLCRSHGIKAAPDGQRTWGHMSTNEAYLMIIAFVIFIYLYLFICPVVLAVGTRFVLAIIFMAQ